MPKLNDHDPVPAFLQHFVGKTIGVLDKNKMGMGGGVFRGCEGSFLLFSEKENDETIAVAVSIDVVAIVFTVESGGGKILSMVPGDMPPPRDT